MRKTRLLILAASAAMVPCLVQAGTLTPTVQQALSGMRTDAQAIQQVATTWPEIQSAALGYGNLTPYAMQQWSGQGPVIHTPLGGVELCHNTHWDTVTAGLVSGGVNVMGDAAAEALAIQTIATDFQQQVANLMIAEVQTNAATAQQLQQSQSQTQTSLNALRSLLNITGQQLQAAISPGSALRQPPFANWRAGIGNVPNLAAARYIAGPNDGAPIGWTIQPLSPLARLLDQCPTGTGSVPMLPVAANVQNAVAVSEQIAPSMRQAFAMFENGSTTDYQQGSGFGSLSPSAGLGGTPNYAVRMQVVGTLSADLPVVAGYMQPVTPALQAYNTTVQSTLSEALQNVQ
jgi:hypothetical protein